MDPAGLRVASDPAGSGASSPPPPPTTTTKVGWGGGGLGCWCRWFLVLDLGSLDLTLWCVFLQELGRAVAAEASCGSRAAVGLGGGGFSALLDFLFLPSWFLICAGWMILGAGVIWKC